MSQQYELKYTANPRSFMIPVTEEENEELYEFYVRKHTEATTRFIVNANATHSSSKLYRTFVEQVCKQMILLDSCNTITDLQVYVKAYTEGQLQMIPNNIAMIFRLYNTQFITQLADSLEQL